MRPSSRPSSARPHAARLSAMRGYGSARRLGSVARLGSAHSSAARLARHGSAAAKAAQRLMGLRPKGERRQAGRDAAQPMLRARALPASIAAARPDRTAQIGRPRRDAV
nr:unnamed protein product [Digitaria exilis]